MGDLDLPDSMDQDEREAFERLFAAASGKSDMMFDPRALSDSVTDIMAGFGSQKAKSRQIARRAVKNMEEEQRANRLRLR